MTTRRNLRDNVNALMAERGWASNKPVIEASHRRLSNGTLGRLRSDEGENVRLNIVDELAEVFQRAPHELLAPLKNDQGVIMTTWLFTPELLAALHNVDKAALIRAENGARIALGLALIQEPPQETGGLAA